MLDKINNSEAPIFPDDIIDKIEVITEKMNIFGGDSDINESTKLFDEAVERFDALSVEDFRNVNTKEYREIRDLFKESIIIRVRNEMGSKEKMMASDGGDKLENEIAGKLKDEASRAGNIPLYKLSLKFVARALQASDRFMPEQESVILQSLLDSAATGDLTAEEAKKLRFIKLAAKGISASTEAIRSAEEIAEYYGVKDLLFSVKKISKMYKEERQNIIHEYTDNGGIGSVEVFDVEASDASELTGGAQQSRRPRRYGDSLGRN